MKTGRNELKWSRGWASRSSCGPQGTAGPTFAISAFTMIEIAISLAVIGFALVAIIGILPTGMNVQKDNREETIIGHDASIFMDAIRNGERGVDDLTNYVLAITNSVTLYRNQGSAGQFLYNQGYTFKDSSTPIKFPLTNGLRIIGLLSTPRFIGLTNPPGAFLSNYVVAYVRSMSGEASEKFPQDNSIVQDLALSYRMIPEIVAYDAKTFNTVPGNYDPNWTNWTYATARELYNPTNAAEIISRSNFWMIAQTLHTNMCDLRLIFRWPLFANGNAGNKRQVFRVTLGGHLNYTNDPFVTAVPLYFFEPRNYAKALIP